MHNQQIYRIKLIDATIKVYIHPIFILLNFIMPLLTITLDTSSRQKYK